MDRFPNMFDLGGGRKGAEERLRSPPSPPPARQRRSNDNDSLEEYSLVSNQRSRSVAGPPTRAVEFTLRGPWKQRPHDHTGGTESQSREGDDDGHYMEPAQAGPSPGGQGTAITPHHPGLQPQPGGQAQTATGPLFIATKGKNIDAYRRHLFAQMKQWAYDRRIQIDQSIYLEQETVKAIVELLQSWGGGGPSRVGVQGAYNLGVPCTHDSRDE
jgi:hypothetical protein